MSIHRGIGPSGLEDSYAYTDSDGDDVVMVTRTPVADNWPADAAALVSSSSPGGAWLTVEQARHLADHLTAAADAAEVTAP